jgi:hypothetical protein
MKLPTIKNTVNEAPIKIGSSDDESEYSEQ